MVLVCLVIALRMGWLLMLTQVLPERHQIQHQQWGVRRTLSSQRRWRVFGDKSPLSAACLRVASSPTGTLARGLRPGRSDCALLNRWRRRAGGGGSWCRRYLSGLLGGPYPGGSLNWLVFAANLGLFLLTARDGRDNVSS